MSTMSTIAPNNNNNPNPRSWTALMTCHAQQNSLNWKRDADRKRHASTLEEPQTGTEAENDDSGNVPPIVGVNGDAGAEVEGREEDDYHQQLLEEEEDPLDKKAKPYFKIKDLPPEIRLLIWTECLSSPSPSLSPVAAAPANGTDGASKPKSSHLIRALRPDPDLYFEALDVFFAVKTFVVDEGMKKGIQATSPAVLGRIGVMEVRYS